MFYSKSTSGFYAAQIHGDSIPEDAVEITADQHAALLAAQSAGQVIVGDTDGNPITVDPVTLPPQVPQQVTRFQARVALYNAGHLPAIDAIMTNPSTPMLTKLAWQDAQYFERTSPTVVALAISLGLNDAQLNTLFIAASQITA